jgi:hypothetical protein
MRSRFNIGNSVAFLILLRRYGPLSWGYRVSCLSHPGKMPPENGVKINEKSTFSKSVIYFVSGEKPKHQ